MSRAGQSKLPERPSHSADPRQPARTYRFALFQITPRNQKPVLGKMGKPVSLTDLSLFLLLLKWQPRCSHPGSKGEAELTPQLLPEQTQRVANTSRQLFCLLCTPRSHGGNAFRALDVPGSVFPHPEFLDHHDEQTFSSWLNSQTLGMSLGVLCEEAESPRKSE